MNKYNGYNSREAWIIAMFLDGNYGGSGDYAQAIEIASQTVSDYLYQYNDIDREELTVLVTENLVTHVNEWVDYMHEQLQNALSEGSYLIVSDLITLNDEDINEACLSFATDYVNNHVTLYRVLWGTEGYLPDNQDDDTIFTEVRDAIEYAEDYINDYLYDLTGDLWDITDEDDLKKLSDMLGIIVTKDLVRLTGAYVYRINYPGEQWEHKLPHYVEVREIE